MDIKLFKTLGRVAFNAGAILQLAAEQAERRRHLLDPVAGTEGVYTVRPDCRTEFKAGETIGTTADHVNKAAMALLRSATAGDAGGDDSDAAAGAADAGGKPPRGRAGAKG